MSINSWKTFQDVNKQLKMRHFKSFSNNVLNPLLEIFLSDMFYNLYLIGHICTFSHCQVHDLANEVSCFVNSFNFPLYGLDCSCQRTNFLDCIHIQYPNDQKYFHSEIPGCLALIWYSSFIFGYFALIWFLL